MPTYGNAKTFCPMVFGSGFVVNYSPHSGELMSPFEFDNKPIKKVKITHDISSVDLEVQDATPKQRSPYKTVVYTVIISLVIHFTLVIFGFLFSPPPSEMLKKERPMRARIVQRVPETKPETMPKQVVTIAKPKEMERPKKANYAAEYNSSVKEETIAQNRSLTPQKLSESAQERRSPSGAQSQRPQQASRAPSEVRSKQILMSKNGLMAKTQAEPQSETKPNLMPTWKDQGMENAKPFSDHLNRMEEDKETRLNTWEWVHAAFFVRVKEAVARRWEPNKALRRHDPRGALVGKNDRATQILASIDRDGKLLSIKVTRESGVYFLDDEAVKAFQEAAPFSNPPKELFASNGTFEFPFGFMLSYNKGFKFDLDWKPY